MQAVYRKRNVVLSVFLELRASPWRISLLLLLKTIFLLLKGLFNNHWCIISNLCRKITKNSILSYP